MPSTSAPSRSKTLTIDRQRMIAWYLHNRERSRSLFEAVSAEAYYSRPISLRNPIVFYEGHLPAFSIIAFLRRGLGRPPIDERLEQIFARGIDPDSIEQAVPRSGASTLWPSREEVLAFGSRADDAIVGALREADLVEDRPAMRSGEAIFTALEHEAMHQETLLYMWHRLPHSQKKPPSNLHYELAGPAVDQSRVTIPSGRATLGANRTTVDFGWDNEFDEHHVDVPEFEIDVFNVTNEEFLQFVDDGGYRAPELWSADDWRWLQAEQIEHPIFWSRRNRQWFWRGMFEDIPLPLGWPVFVSQAEASAFARWRGRRLPTEAEYHRAAFGTPDGKERQHPWGDAMPEPSRGNFDFSSWEPVPVGSRPAGTSAWGVHDLVGNGWEWTSTVFAPFPGFEAMVSYPEYSAEFFDGQHFVMKGASPATAKELVRRSFRNWFRPNYPYVYATFRTVVS